MRQTFATNFYCRSSKAGRNGDSPVELSIIVNGERTFVQLPFRCNADEFKKAVQSKKPNYIKDYLEEVRIKLRDAQLDLMRNGLPLTANTLKDNFISGGIKAHTIRSLCDEYLGLLRKRIGKTLTPGAYKKYQNAIDCFCKYQNPDTLLIQVTPSIMAGFLVDCQGKYESSTTSGIMTKIKTVFVYALDNGYIRVNPFQNLKYPRGHKEIVYLTEEEMNVLYNLDIDNKSLSDVRDAFLLQASTGLAYIDIFHLQKEDIKIDGDGTHYIIKKRQKTGVQYTTIILTMGVEILKKHNYKLHIISNQKYNLFLKTLGSLAGIDKHLTTHVARKTFATTMLNRGVRLEVVSKMLGHSSVVMTESLYSKMLSSTIIDEVKSVL